MEPPSIDPYQPPKEPSLPPEPTAKKPGGRVPLGVGAGLLFLGGFTTPSAAFGVMGLTFAVLGILMASSILQRVGGIVLSALSLTVIYFTWQS
ncbi:MAG: hypothetical protein EOP83_22850 [Verrucomicrobiaceae bacterium]|nr:MAG: hypothetical protein EOP83_22850 [Verrucomicrobiaceae bacterium]